MPPIKSPLHMKLTRPGYRKSIRKNIKGCQGYNPSGLTFRHRFNGTRQRFKRSKKLTVPPSTTPHLPRSPLTASMILQTFLRSSVAIKHLLSRLLHIHSIQPKPVHPATPTSQPPSSGYRTSHRWSSTIHGHQILSPAFTLPFHLRQSQHSSTYVTR